jgi:hypothetical protein
MCHDIGHPGTNNAFQVNTMSDLAITYNDKAVLENFHCSTTFQLLMQPELNILVHHSLSLSFSLTHSLVHTMLQEGLQPEEYHEIRKLLISCVLATDPVCSSHHFSSTGCLCPPVNSMKFPLL